SLGGTCHTFGASRFGFVFPLLGRFQRLGVVPDGSGVVAEITNDQSVNPTLAPDPPEEGIFFFGSDGTRRRLGNASPVPIFPVVVHPDRDPPFTVFSHDVPYFNFSPDARHFAMTQLAPSADGETAQQIFVVDVASGRREPVTHLPPGG